MIQFAAALAVTTVMSLPAAVVDDAVTVDVASEVDGVVLYGLGADIRRSTTVALEAGIHELVFAGIPDPGNEGLDGVRASVNPPFAVLGVDVTVRERRAMDDPGSLAAAVREAETALRGVELERKGVENDLGFIEAIGVRAAGDATSAGGTAELDLEVVASQLRFVRAERTRLQAELLDATRRVEDATAALERARRDLARSGEVSRETVATVRVAAPEPGEAMVSLRYLRRDAGWRPSYSIRSVGDQDVMPVEYEAIVRQATGEDWSGIDLTLSTATPSSPSGPAEIRPVFVDRRRDAERAVEADNAVPMPADALGEAFGSGAGRGRGAARKSAAVAAMRDAAVATGGTAVTFVLPREVSVPSDRERTARLRIADIAAPATRVLVARPLMDEKVYLRGDLVNESPFVLLSGEASLFMEGEFIGPTRVDEVPAGGAFEIWFGVDPSLTVTRRLVVKETEKTGLFNGGLQTSLSYRIDLRNDGDAPATVEVWDRRPVSRDGDIEVGVRDLSMPLATDAAYRDIDEPQGLLKWVVTLAAGEAQAITWTVRVNRSGDIDMTPIPE